MWGKQRFERWYMKYIVKSPWVFYTYLSVFFCVFFIVSSRLELEERRAYEGEIDGNEVEIACGAEVELFDDRLYLYVDKNQEVFSFDVRDAEYGDGAMHILLDGEQSEVSGKITVEIVSGKNTLFQRIFGKAGTV